MGRPHYSHFVTVVSKQYNWQAGLMSSAGYNSAIPEIDWKSVNRVSRFVPATRVLPVIFLLGLLGAATLVRAADWSTAEQQLARKIVAATGPGAVAVTFEDRSSLGRRDSEVVRNGMRMTLEQLGIRMAKADQAAATVTISLSENPTSYVWVAQIHQGTADTAVVMVSVARAGRATMARDSMPMILRKSLIWTQDDPVLDLAVLEESGTPSYVAVLNAENVTLYRMQGGKWQQEQVLEITHAKPWPRDLRGRLVPARDHLFDVYLPGVTCHSGAGGAALSLSCRETDDPWPMAAGQNMPVFPAAGSPVRGPAIAVPTMAFFASSRNFFTGVLTPAVGKFSTVPKFYSAAFLPRDKYTLWLFAATDGKVHIVDGMSDQISRVDWGSDIASVKTACGVGWQVLAPGSGAQTQDSVRAYELPDRDPVAVSAAVDLPGAISALWTEARGDTAVAMVRNRETGSYEVDRLDLACSQ
jgi:hypothetical protein